LRDSPSLRIAWLGPAPNEEGGVAGVAAALLGGLADRGHVVDCFFPGTSAEVPAQLRNRPNLTFQWSGTRWRWDRWYSRHPIAAFITSLATRARGFMRLRRAIAAAHVRAPYDLVYQFSNVEAFGMPRALRRTVPLVIHPETHAAGELRCFVAERELGMRCHNALELVGVGLVLLTRSIAQRLMIRRAALLVCISTPFRDHLVRDYRYPLSKTVVVPNPVDLERFRPRSGGVSEPARLLVLGRVSVRKGVEQIVTLSHALRSRNVDARIRIVGGHSLWSDYRPLLTGLDTTVAEYAGPIAADLVPLELQGADVLIQASSYEPFGLTVAEALASGVPVVATSEVGAVSGSSGEWYIETEPGDADGLADGVTAILARLRAAPGPVRRAARAHAERSFDPGHVVGCIVSALETLLEGRNRAD